MKLLAKLHLGLPACLTVADKRIQYSSNSTIVDYYTADIITANDYYPGVYMYTDNEILTAGGNLNYSPSPNHKGASGLTNHPADQMFLLALSNTYRNWLNSFSGYYEFDKTTRRGYSWGYNFS